MGGHLARYYTRCRGKTPAFDHDRRQREVLLALRNRVLEPGISGLLPRLLELLDTMRDHVQTDLDAAEILALAQLIPQIPPHDISHGVLDLTPAPEWSTPEGTWVMLPQRHSIKEYVNGRMPPPTWEEAGLATEEIGFAIDNGTTIEGFAYQIADRLR